MSANRTVIVTGGNSGLGYDCVKSILRAGDGWHVAVAGRDRGRCDSADERISFSTS
ncbi:MAG: hypothetical protein ACLQGP_02345 [Isosphaeraceae bacterium]